MEITIGMQNLARELTLRVSKPAESIVSAVAAALEAGSVLTLTDDDGRVTLVNAAAIGFVSIGDDSRNFVGFSA